MIRNIPNKYQPDAVLEEIGLAGFTKCYDFFYLPIDFKNKCNVGYAFINLTRDAARPRWNFRWGFQAWVRLVSGRGTMILKTKPREYVGTIDRPNRILVETRGSSHEERNETHIAALCVVHAGTTRTPCGSSNSSKVEPGIASNPSSSAPSRAFPRLNGAVFDS